MTTEIILNEADIQSIINGRTVKKTIADGTKVSIRQSYVRDMAAPVINDRFNVRDAVAEARAKDFRNSTVIPDLMERG